MRSIGFAGPGGGDEELEILRIARADLDDVRVFRNEVRVRFGKQFGDDRQAGFLARFGQEFEPLLAEALEFVGGSARFERAAAQDGGTGGFYGFGGFQQLHFALDRARARP